MDRSDLTAALRRLVVRSRMTGSRRWCAVVFAACVLAGVFFWRLLPAQLFDDPESYVLEARDGTLLSARIASDGQWRFPPRGTVPLKFRRALLVFEDKRFESHAGVDGLAIARAVRLNLRAGRVVSGGSTLTMQLARLSRGRERRDLSSKVSEALLALRIEASYDKEEILAMYAGHAPFGGNVVGLEAAAWRYSVAIRTAFHGRKRRRSRCCRTIPRSCTSRVTGSA